jgi:HAMP domain-containing protein
VSEAWQIAIAGMVASALTCWSAYIQVRLNNLSSRVDSGPTRIDYQRLADTIERLAGSVNRLEGYLEARDGRHSSAGG